MASYFSIFDFEEESKNHMIDSYLKLVLFSYVQRPRAENSWKNMNRKEEAKYHTIKKIHLKRTITSKLILKIHRNQKERNLPIENAKVRK